MEDMVLSDKDQDIMTILLSNPKGLRYGVLWEKLGWHKKVFQDHLNSLLKHKIIYKEKDETKAKNSTAIYHAYLTEDKKQLVNDVSEFYLRTKKLFENKKINKKASLSAIPHLIQVYASVYYLIIQHYLFEPKGDLLFPVFIKLMNQYIDELKDFITTNFSKTQIKRIYDESDIIFENDNDVAHEKVMNALFGRPYYRTQDEILRDNEHRCWDDFYGNIDKDLKIPKRRLNYIKNPRVKYEIEKLEKKYVATRKKIHNIYIDLIFMYGTIDKSKEARQIEKTIFSHIDLLRPEMDKHTAELDKKIEKKLSKGISLSF